MKGPALPAVPGGSGRPAARAPSSSVVTRAVGRATGGGRATAAVTRAASAARAQLARGGASLLAPGAIFQSAARGLAGYAGPSAGTQTIGAVAGVTPFTPRQIARLLRRGRAMLDNLHVRAFVLGLQGCLPELPARLRTVLRLRVGIDERRPLSARAVARRLHISRKRLSVLEVRAMRGLSKAARTTGCAARGAAASSQGFAPVLFASISTVGAAGGVAGGLYFKEASEPGAQTVPPGEAIAAPTLHVAQGSDAPLAWALVAVLAGGLLVAYLVRRDMGLGLLPVGRRRRRRSGSDRASRLEGSDED